MIDTNALIYYAYVVEEGSFQAAANRLGIPKSTLSRQISALESALKVQLLHRTTRHLSVTEAGEQLLPSCQRLAEEQRLIQDLSQDISSQPRGTIRITAPVTAGRIFLSRWLAEFCVQFPEIVLDVNLSDEEQNMAAQGFDVAIRVGYLRDSTLVSRPLATTPRIVCASPELLQQHRIESVSDLCNIPAIVYSRSLSNYNWKLQNKGNTVDVPITARLILNDMTSVLEAVSYAAGIALVPAMVANVYIQNGRLQRVLPEYQGEEAPFHLIYLRRENLPNKTRLLIEHILQRAKQERELFQ
ncbi:MAG: LysR family transcriptional regulator [Gammaproteobacteria bacterium]|nr:LysR family transcriptional regulator [Gammaproteobacteria bacterium]